MSVYICVSTCDRQSKCQFNQPFEQFCQYYPLNRIKLERVTGYSFEQEGITREQRNETSNKNT